MKILFVTPFPPVHDGIGTYSEMLCGELGRQGHEVAVVSSRSTEAPHSIVLGALPAPGRSVDSIAAAVGSFAPDVVHLQFAGSAYGARLRGLLHLLDRLRADGRSVVTTLHDITRDLETLGPIGRVVYRSVDARTDRVIVHTETAFHTHAQLSDGSASARVVPHPRVELPASTGTPADLRRRFGLGEDQVVLSFGFIHVDKGISDLLRAVGQLRAGGGFQRRKVVIAGEVRRRYGPLRLFELRDRLYLRELRRITVQERLAANVVFTGFVPAGEVRSWFDLATVVVLPYRRIEQSGSGSLARGAGAPLLATDVGELADLSTFPPVSPGDSEALAGALAAALDDGDRTRVPPGADDDLAAVVSQTADIYAELIEADARSVS